jgi:hypothetical protein
VLVAVPFRTVGAAAAVALPLHDPRDVEPGFHLDPVARFVLEVRNQERLKTGVGSDARWTDQPKARVARLHMQLQGARLPPQDCQLRGVRSVICVTFKCSKLLDRV